MQKSDEIKFKEKTGWISHTFALSLDTERIEMKSLDLSNNMDYLSKTITKIDKQTIQFIKGYIRQKTLKSKFHESNIPNLLIHIMILYTFNFEYFAQRPSLTFIVSDKAIYDTIISESIQEFKTRRQTYWKMLVWNDRLSNDDFKTKHLLLQSLHTVYGNVEINNKISCIYQWEFEIVRVLNNNIGFGIDASNKIFTTCAFYLPRKVRQRPLYVYGDYDLKNTPYYALHASTNDGNLKLFSLKDRWLSKQEFIAKPSFMNYKLKDGDMVKMKLCIQQYGKSTLKFLINNKDEGIIFDDIIFDAETKYNMAIYIESGGIIALTSFEKINLD